MRGQLTAHRIKLDYVDLSDGRARLDQVFARLDRAVSSPQVAAAIVDGGRSAAGANSGAVVLLTPDRHELTVVYSVGGEPSGAARAQALPLDARFPLCDVVRSRRELWLTNPSELAERYPAMSPSGGASAWAALPLQIDGVILGAIGWSFHRQWLSSYQRACLRALAEAGGVALYRAGVFDSERTTRMQAELATYEMLRQDRVMAKLSSTLDAVDNPEDVPSTLEQIARLTLPRLGEWCCIQIADERGHLRSLATVHLDPAHAGQVDAGSRESSRSTRKLSTALNSGQPLIVRDGDVDSLRAGGLSGRQTAVLRTLGLDRVLIVALRIHERTLGTIAFATATSALTYSTADVAVAERIARRCASWLEYIRLREIAGRAEQAREDFVAATSHELRTPLSHIKGFVSTLRSNDSEWNAETRDDFLAEIEHEADRLASLVDTLLDISRIDSGGLDTTQRLSISPVDLVSGGIDRVRPTLGNRLLDIQVAPDVPPVWADAPQVERVIANLLDNASKYSPADQPIGITARASGKSVLFRVEDRGLGIPSAHIERIFEPFFREPTGPYPSKPGTGLGLSICRSIIRSQRGRIWAEQRPGGGAVIAFTLPTATGTQRT